MQKLWLPSNYNGTIYCLSIADLKKNTKKHWQHQQSPYYCSSPVRELYPVMKIIQYKVCDIVLIF